MAEIKTIYLFLSRVVDRQKDKMNGEVKMKFNIKSDVDTTRKEMNLRWKTMSRKNKRLSHILIKRRITK